MATRTEYPSSLNIVEPKAIIKQRSEEGIVERAAAARLVGGDEREPPEKEAFKLYVLGHANSNRCLDEA